MKAKLIQESLEINESAPSPMNSYVVICNLGRGKGSFIVENDEIYSVFEYRGDAEAYADYRNSFAHSSHFHAQKLKDCEKYISDFFTEQIESALQLAADRVYADVSELTN